MCAGAAQGRRGTAPGCGRAHDNEEVDEERLDVGAVAMLLMLLLRGDDDNDDDEDDDAALLGAWWLVQYTALASRCHYVYSKEPTPATAAVLRRRGNRRRRRRHPGSRSAGEHGDPARSRSSACCWCWCLGACGSRDAHLRHCSWRP